MALRYDAHKKSGNLDGLTAGTVVGGNALVMGDNARQKVRNLSALVDVEAATASLTLTVKWQVSNDGSNWVDVANGPQNAASVTLATAPATATKAFDAPESVYGWRQARVSLVTDGATGSSSDTYALSYCYRAGR